MVGAVVYLARVWYEANLVIGDNGELLELTATATCSH
jgi:hypothetical protein